MPNPGYGAEREMRFKHPSGLYETLVSNEKSLSSVDPKNSCSQSVCNGRKKEEGKNCRKAKEMKIKVLNA